MRCSGCSRCSRLLKGVSGKLFGAVAEPTSIRDANRRIQVLTELIRLNRVAIEKHGEQAGYVQNLNLYTAELRYLREWIAHRKGKL